MSIVIEAWTLVVRIDAVQSRYPGGVEAFLRSVPNRSFHRDTHLAGVSFFTFEEVQGFGLDIQAKSGLGAFIHGAWQHMVPTDQVDGVPSTCDWLEVEKHPEGFTHCWLKGTEAGEVAARDGWTLEDSRALRHFLPAEAEEKLQPVTLLHGSIQAAIEMAGVQGVVEKDTGRLLYGSKPQSRSGATAPQTDDLVG
jgi:hypothetical protein